MQVPCNNLSEVVLKLREYQLQERPLNLEEMQNVENVLNAVMASAKEVITEYKKHSIKAQDFMTLMKAESVLGVRV